MRGANNLKAASKSLVLIVGMISRLALEDPCGLGEIGIAATSLQLILVLSNSINQ